MSGETFAHAVLVLNEDLVPDYAMLERKSLHVFLPSFDVACATRTEKRGLESCSNAQAVNKGNGVAALT